jgi:hypothetical protein
MKKKVNIIGINPTSFEQALNEFEYEFFVKDLLSDYDVDVHFIYDKLDLFIEDAIIIYSSDEYELNPKLKEYFNTYKEKNISFNLYHISNEQLNHNCSYYDWAKNVFRNYYDASINKENVITLPLGYKGGFFNKNQDYLLFEDKEYDFCFVGQLKNDRFELVDVIRTFEKNFVHLTHQWDCPTSINSKDLFKIYSKTFLIPCPMGNVNQDTFRICEVLESGSIPVIRQYSNNEYFKNIFGDHPIPVVKSWSELNELSQIIKNNPNQKIKEINEWYVNFKNNLKIKIDEKLFRTKI